MKHIGQVLSKSIKEGKWVAINYVNASNEKTFYWCSIQDIDIDNKSLFVHAFNQTKVDANNDGLIRPTIQFDRIQSAFVVEGTTYNVPPQLINKIETEKMSLDWLEYDLYDEGILSYIKDCMIYDQPPYQRESALIKGVDQDVLKNEGTYQLNYEQLGILAQHLEKISSQMENHDLTTLELIINDLSIHTPKGRYVIAYKRINFNPAVRSIIMDDDIHFNYSFIMDEKDINIHNLRNYLDVDVETFTTLYVKNPIEAKLLLSENLRYDEKLDEMPYLMDQIRHFNINIVQQMRGIAVLMSGKDITTPLLAFFGNMSSNRLGRKDDYQIVTLNNQVNISQLRVIANALKHPITYVQGPPGTGKTHSIINLLISTFFNDQTVLVSSNNNKPIDDIYEKLTNLKYRDRTIPLPVLRLGNRDRVLEAIKYIQYVFEHYGEELSRPNEKQLLSKKQSSESNFSIINSIIKDHEQKLKIKERMDALGSVVEAFEKELRISVVLAEYEKLKKEFEEYPNIDEDSVQDHVQKADQSFLMWLYYQSLDLFNKFKKEPKYQKLISIIDQENESQKVTEFNRYVSEPENLNDLLKIFPIIMTTNMSAARLGEPEPVFDLAIIDEAGQCSIGYALFSIARAKKLLLVGDLNQLKPVITLSHHFNRKLMNIYKIPEVYNYLDHSILGLMQLVDYISPFVLLNYHYRSHKDIIGFSNNKYYKGELKIKTQDLSTKALFLANSKNEKKYKTQPQKNTSEEEAIMIAEDIKNKGLKDVGVITPFRNQAEMLRNVFKEYKLDNVEVGTIHTFQGDEKDTIYFSAAITPYTRKATFDWVKDNVELINVATTRPKKELVMVANVDEINKRSEESNDLKELVDYISKNGEKVTLTPKNELMTINSHNYHQYNTEAEEELFQTIKHFLSTADQYEVQTQVKVADLLNRLTHPVLYDYGTKASFDFVLYLKRGKNKIPVLVIELNGPEHDSNKVTIWRDEKKAFICKENNIKLLKIKNDYSRRYLFVKDSILSILTQ